MKKMRMQEQKGFALHWAWIALTQPAWIAWTAWTAWTAQSAMSEG